MRPSKRQRSQIVEIAELSATSGEFGKLPLPYQQIAMFYGFVANDVATFRKLFIISMNTALSVRDRPTFYKKYSNAQAFAILRVFAGKTLEGWEAINKQVDGVQPMRDLREGIEKHAPGVHKICNKYFAKANAITIIRNKFSFHMDPSHWTGENNVDIEASVGLQCYVRDGLNSLYATSESLLLLQIMAGLGHRITIKQDHSETHGHLEHFEEEWEKIVEEISAYGERIISICDAIVLSVIEKAEDLGVDFVQTRHKVRDASSIDSVKLPVFTARSFTSGTSK